MREPSRNRPVLLQESAKLCCRGGVFLPQYAARRSRDSACAARCPGTFGANLKLSVIGHRALRMGLQRGARCGSRAFRVSPPGRTISRFLGQQGATCEAVVGRFVCRRHGPLLRHGKGRENCMVPGTSFIHFAHQERGTARNICSGAPPLTLDHGQGSQQLACYGLGSKAKAVGSRHETPPLRAAPSTSISRHRELVHYPGRRCTQTEGRCAANCYYDICMPAGSDLMNRFLGPRAGHQSTQRPTTRCLMTFKASLRGEGARPHGPLVVEKGC